MKMSDTTLITFRAITTFANELSDLFGKQQKSLKLYCRLINKTTLAHNKPIQKHIDAFKLFCISNREAITTKNVSKLVNDKIEYSSRVYIYFPSIFTKADTETTDAIWKHLLLISAYVDPTGNAKEILRDHVDGQEANFLTDIINKVEKHVEPGTNPMQAVSSIIQSGVFTDLIGGMNTGIQDGSLDLGKLVGAVQEMVSTLSDQNGNNEGDQTMNMINTMMSSIGNKSGSTEGGPPQISDMLSMMGPMLASLGGNDGIPDITSMMSSLGTIQESTQAQISENKSTLDIQNVDTPDIQDVE
jgi:hypothetical protein